MFLTASSVTTWSYEKAPCNVLVDESSGISVAKSTLEDPSIVRPKPSISSAAAQSSGTTLAVNTQSSPTNGAVAGVNTAGGRLKRTHRNKRDAVHDINGVVDAPLMLLGLHENSNSLVGDGETTQYLMESTEHVNGPNDETETTEDSTKLLTVTNPPRLNEVDESTASSHLYESSPIAEYALPFDDMLPQNDGPVIGSDPVGIDFVSLENLNLIEPSVHTMDKDEPLPVPLVPYVVETHPADHVRYEMHDADSSPDKTGNSTESETKVGNGMQRILVNVSIATDSGQGTQHHAVYMLHVSVPAGPQFNFDNSEMVENKTAPTGNVEQKQVPLDSLVDDSSCLPPEPPPVPPSCPCDCQSLKIEVENVTDDQETTESSVSSTYKSTTMSEFANKTTASASVDPSLACLYSQDVPTILILEGELKFK